MDSRSFIRKSWYVSPPSSNASAEEWENWIEQDNKAAKVDKRQFNKARKAQSIDSTPDFHTAKVGGVYKQVRAVGFVGESAGGHIEPIQEAQQEGEIDRARQALNSLHKSGGDRKGRNKFNRIKLRQARKAKYRNRG
jgi:hypothetical protein